MAVEMCGKRELGAVRLVRTRSGGAGKRDSPPEGALTDRGRESRQPGSAEIYIVSWPLRWGSAGKDANVGTAVPFWNQRSLAARPVRW